MRVVSMLVLKFCHFKGCHFNEFLCNCPAFSQKDAWSLQYSRGFALYLYYLQLTQNQNTFKGKWRKIWNLLIEEKWITGFLGRSVLKMKSGQQNYEYRGVLNFDRRFCFSNFYVRHSRKKSWCFFALIKLNIATDQSSIW